MSQLKIEAKWHLKYLFKITKSLFIEISLKNVLKYKTNDSLLKLDLNG